MDVILTSDIKMLLHLLHVLRRFTSHVGAKCLQIHLQQHDVTEKHLEIPTPYTMRKIFLL